MSKLEKVGVSVATALLTGLFAFTLWTGFDVADSHMYGKIRECTTCVSKSVTVGK